MTSRSVVFHYFYQYWWVNKIWIWQIYSIVLSFNTDVITIISNIIFSFFFVCSRTPWLLQPPSLITLLKWAIVVVYWLFILSILHPDREIRSAFPSQNKKTHCVIWDDFSTVIEFLLLHHPRYVGNSKIDIHCPKIFRPTTIPLL